MFVVYNDPESDDEVTAFHVIVGTIDQKNEIASAPGTLANVPEVKQILDTLEVLRYWCSERDSETIKAIA
jgi:hypothetical protein